MSDVDKSLAEARTIRYLIDSLNDKSAVSVLLNTGDCSSALFHIEQLCEKSTKACLAILGILLVGKSVKERSLIKAHLFSDAIKVYIIPESGDLADDFKKLISSVREIESYYIPVRYGVDTNGNISFEEYDEADVREIYEQSLKYLELCFKFIEQKYGKSLPRDINELKNIFKTNYIGFVTK
jgi:HEPN domain-containing protein